MDKIEYKRTCNKCGKVWYAPKEYIDKLKSGKTDGTIAALFFDPAQGSRNRQSAEVELMKINMCPDCNSMDFKEDKQIIPAPIVANAVPMTESSTKTIIIAMIIVGVILGTIILIQFLIK